MWCYNIIEENIRVTVLKIMNLNAGIMLMRALVKRSQESYLKKKTTT